MNKQKYKKKWLGAATVFVILAVAAIGIKLMPRPLLLENYSFSTAMFDRNGELMRLNLSRDDKYRLKVKLADIPVQTKQALLLYEDKWFYYHCGFNPISLGRAFVAMIGGGRRQGASTITMQVARQVYHIDSSTLLGKAEQLWFALMLELFYSKDEILEAYFNISPYGGNIEGIGAAALIYFGVEANRLDLPQSILLTVVPQNPVKRSLLDAKGRMRAVKAADRLKQQWRQNYPTEEIVNLDLPVKVLKKLPFIAPHTTQRLKKEAEGRVVLTIDIAYQDMLEKEINRFIQDNKIKGIENAAAMIVDYKSREVLAAVGSADFFDKKIKGQVDGTRALRSPGSVLKPFIYALALEQGLIHPLTMLKDVPRNYGLYTPENFDHSFYGLISATEALVKSRNVPAVDLLKSLKPNSFYNLLQKVGVEKLREPEFYGLALALGGAEVSLETTAAMYAMLGNHGKYVPLKYQKNEILPKERQLISKEAAFLTLKMLEQNPVPDDDRLPYQKERQSYKVYWKTGTSYGFKDAWTAGLAGNYAVVVWVGNFDGLPNNNLVGRLAAAPLFFRIIRRLDLARRLTPEIADAAGLNVRLVDICQTTGDLADAYCSQKRLGYFIPGVTQIKLSNISRLIPVWVDTGKRACRHQPPKTRLERYEFWSSDVKKAFNEAGVHLRQPPEFGENCPLEQISHGGSKPQIIFPVAESTLVLRLKNKAELIPLRATADADVSKIYWFINNFLVGESRPDEVLPAQLLPGKNTVRAVDNLGREHQIEVQVKQVN